MPSRPLVEVEAIACSDRRGHRDSPRRRRRCRPRSRFVGGRRRPGPTIVGAIAAAAGRRPPVAPLISVVERFALVAPPARNSVTRPVTVTAVPGVSAGSGALLVNTKTPSEVRSVAVGARVLDEVAVGAPGGDDARHRRDDHAAVGRDVGGALDVVDAQARDARVGVEARAEVGGGMGAVRRR